MHTPPKLFACAAVLAASLLACMAPVRAQDCTEAQFAAAVDKAGASLRTYNKDAQPRLKARLEDLARQKGWPQKQAEEKGLAYLEDGRLAELDAEANEHLSKIDQLGRVGDGKTPDCANLKALEAAGQALLGVMNEKSAYLLGKIDRETAPRSEKTAEAAPVSAPAREAKPANEKPAPKPAPPKEAAAPPPTPQFETTLIPSDAFIVDEQGYSIDEIRDASRGFFGTLSAELGNVIEHAFAMSGRPTAYILGSEGGGALLAGLRYGKGTLYLRSGGSQPIYWHGPSLGSDIGADGSRTLYLVYRLKDPNELYRRFAGVDGSAYLVGGVGITFLKGGNLIMAPIRTGIGLRLGASVGFLRFTAQPTWNPF